MNDWVPEERDVPPELEDNYTHEVYPPAATKFPDWVTALESSTAATLREWASGIGEPHVNG